MKGTEVGKEELLIRGCVAEEVSTNADDVLSWDVLKGHINCISEGEVFTFLVSHYLQVCSTDLTLGNFVGTKQDRSHLNASKGKSWVSEKHCIKVRHCQVLPG